MEKSKAANALRVLIPVFVIALLVAVASTILLVTDKKQHEEVRDTIELKVGAKVPDFEMTTLKGEKKKFSEVRKKLTLVNFWATWCGPCVEEIPSLNRLYERLKGEGFEIIGVNMDEEPAEVLPAFLKKVPIDFPIYTDSEGALADRLSIGGLPFTVVINEKDEVMLVELGEREWYKDADQFSAWLKGAGANP